MNTGVWPVNRGVSAPNIAASGAVKASCPTLSVCVAINRLPWVAMQSAAW